MLLPGDRNKTLTGLAGAEPISGAQHREVQRLQWLVSESAWEHEQINQWRVRLLGQDSATAPHDGGVLLVVDDTGDRKDGTATPTWPARIWGRWASSTRHRGGDQPVGRCALLWPVQAVPYTPASRLAGGGRDPGSKTKPQLAVELVRAAQQAGIGFRAVVADCCSGDPPGFAQALSSATVPFALALKPPRAPGRRPSRSTPVEAAGELGWGGPSRPGRWRRIQRRFRDGHTEDLVGR